MFIVVTNSDDAQLLDSFGLGRVRTFFNGYDSEHWVFINDRDLISGDIVDIGLQGMYIVTDSLAF